MGVYSSFPCYTNMNVRHVIPVTVMLGGYACIAYITHFTQGFYTYGFLDPSKHSHGVLAGILIGMGALVIAMFMLSWCLIWLRLWVTEVHMGLPGRFSARDRARVRSTSIKLESSRVYVGKDGAEQERIELVDKDEVHTAIHTV